MDIKGVIKERGFTLDRVASELKERGIMPRASKSSLSQSINGNPNLSTLQAIAEVIGCKMVDFFQDEQAPFSAIIKYNGELKEVTSVGELEKIVSELKKEGK
jgi:transcriptional regulator with XRE-family HTH domain